MKERRKTPLVFYRTAAGGEPVREWLKRLNKEDRHAVGLDLMRAQWRWPIGMPLCRPMGAGLWEVRTDLPGARLGRVLFCVHKAQMVALHGFIKTTRATPNEELKLARKRKKEIEQ